MSIIQLPYLFVKKHGVVLVHLPEEKNDLVYYINNISWPVINEIQRFTSKPFTLTQIDNSEFQKKLTAIYQAKDSLSNATQGMKEYFDLSTLANKYENEQDLLNNQDDAPIIKLLNALFTKAIQQQASDIHIETYQDRVIVRNRIDGILQEVLDIDRQIAPLVISRVKVMAKLDIAEKRIPQDGRISLRIGDNNIDVRVSTLPSNHGERIVLRILDKESAQLNLALLGMNENIFQEINKLIAQPNGIILVTGPTGSGKTTSLYAMLTDLNEVSRNILTIEDPIEYDLPGVGQTQVNNKIQMSFAKGLRAILRQDPDVVMIGEIRDLETAEIAVQASLTGHLVLSTLHTNSALGALTRLHDMGIEPFLLSSSIIGLIAQRLVRKLCPHCKVPYELREDEKNFLQLSGRKKHNIYQPKAVSIVKIQDIKVELVFMR